MTKQYSLIKHFKLIVYLFLLAFISKSAISKQNEEGVFYLFKKDWSLAKDIKQAAYFMQLKHDNDSTYICRYYNKFSSMIRQESYLDSTFTIPNGRFCWYDQNGMLDSTGLVNRKRKTGAWKYYDDNGQLTVVIIYNNGHLVEKRDYLKKEFTDEKGNKIPYSINKDAVPDARIADSSTGEVLFKNISIGEEDSNEQWKDYLKKAITVPERFINVYGNFWCNAVISFIINNEGKPDDIYLTHSCEWSADDEVLQAVKKSPPMRVAKKYENSVEYSLQQDVTFFSSLSRNSDTARKSKVLIGVMAPEKFSGAPQVQATFPGGPQGWAHFLQQHLNAGVPTNNRAPAGTYTVVVSFLVQENGTVEEVKAEQDPGYGTAEEVIRLFKKSPKWIPATMDGKPVKYRQKQAITFQVSEY